MAGNSEGRPSGRPSGASAWVWREGAVVEATPQAPAAGVSCYTTARWLGERILWREPVAERLVRDARALGLGEIDEVALTAAIEALARTCFGSGEGIVRFEARAGVDGKADIRGNARDVGAEPAFWHAVRSRELHPGPAPAAGAKLPRSFLALARKELQAAGADEVLLADASGHLVEGARTNLIVATDDGRWLTPPLTRGGVRGVARDRLLAAEPRLVEGDVSTASLERAREVVATNSVRGARPIVSIDGQRVGDGHPGPLAARAASILRPRA